MKKSTKGAVAAGTAAVLLTGGVGSLAYWTDTTILDGGGVQTGQMALGDADCDPGWNHQGGGAVTKIVPGDVLTKDCTFTITAEGDNLEATLTTPETVTYTASGGGTPVTRQLTVGASYKIGAVAAPEIITSAHNGSTVTATLTVTFPYGDATTINANDTQNLTATLDDVTVSLVQNS